MSPEEFKRIWQELSPSDLQNFAAMARSPEAKVAVVKGSDQDRFLSALVELGVVRALPAEEVMPGQPADLVARVAGYASEPGQGHKILDAAAGFPTAKGD